MANPVGQLLVVDDDEMSRLVLSRSLERVGHQVQMAAGGPEALAKAQVRTVRCGPARTS